VLSLSLPETRLLIAAVTVADERNFTRAADRLKITQPALSKRIAELENLLGFSVFSREQRGLELTTAGQVFVRGCKDALAILERAVRASRATQEDIQPVVTVGHSPCLDYSMITALLGIHLPLYPSLRLRMETMFNTELVHSILSAELDLAIMEKPVDNPRLTIVHISTNPLYVLMSRDHPASHRASISFEDFGNVGWMIFPKRANPILYDKVLEAGKQAGVAPVELHHYMAPQEVTHLIPENFGIAFMEKGMAEQLANVQMVALPLAVQTLQVTTCLVLRADQTSRLVNEFGRAFLRRVITNPQQAEASGQLLLKL
jgi:DNA-binding transcriptional LysR family regulator